MHRIRTAAAALIAFLISCLYVGMAAGEVVVQVGTSEARPGGIVAVAVTVQTDGEPLAGFQNDLFFEPEITPLGRGESRAHCSHNPDLLPGELGLDTTLLSEEICGFGDECVRATARLSSETFPPGRAVVYTCTVQVARDAAPGTYPVRCRFLNTTTLAGEPLPASCADGAIVVDGDPVDVTPNLPPTPTMPPSAEGPPILTVADVSGRPGDRVTVEFRLRRGEVPITGLQADMAFPAGARIAARANGNPDCAFGADPNFAGYSGVSFQPPGCSDDACTGMRALLITAETVSIPDGNLMLSCSLDIAADAAAGVYVFSLSNLLASTGAGEEVVLEGDAGTLRISEEPAPAPQEPTPTSTVAAEPSSTAVPTLASHNEGQNPISGAGASQSSSGCAVSPGQRSLGRWELVILAALVALRHRRRRYDANFPWRRKRSMNGA